MANPYAFGTRSEETKRLQQALAGLGLYADAVDGIFGRNTQAAVAAARARLGLGAGGVEQQLLAALGLAAAPSNPLLDFALRQVGGLLIAQLKGHLPMGFLAGYRTYLVAALMLLTGIAGLMGIDIPRFTGEAPANLVMEALAFFFLRRSLKIDGGK